MGELVKAKFKRLDTTQELEANAVVSINKVPRIKEIEYLPAGGGRLRGFPQRRNKGYCQRCCVRLKVASY